MAFTQWASDNWANVLQNVGIIGGLAFTAYSTWKGERARRISNLIAITAQYREIWQELYTTPRLARVLKADVDLNKEPVTGEEEMFVNFLILHLDTVYHAMKAKMFVRVEGLQKDIQDFLSLPIPRATWDKNKIFQNRDFVRFIETCRQAA